MARTNNSTHGLLTDILLAGIVLMSGIEPYVTEWYSTSDISYWGYVGLIGVRVNVPYLGERWECVTFKVQIRDLVCLFFLVMPELEGSFTTMLIT